MWPVVFGKWSSHCGPEHIHIHTAFSVSLVGSHLPTCDGITQKHMIVKGVNRASISLFLHFLHLSLCLCRFTLSLTHTLALSFSALNISSSLSSHCHLFPFSLICILSFLFISPLLAYSLCPFSPFLSCRAPLIPQWFSFSLFIC